MYTTFAAHIMNIYVYKYEKHFPKMYGDVGMDGSAKNHTN